MGTEKESPSVRLVGCSTPGSQVDNVLVKKQEDAPAVRLVQTSHSQLQRTMVGPSIKLSLQPEGNREQKIMLEGGNSGISYDLPEESWPSILVSYVYLDTFTSRQANYRYRDWVLDSGAYTAHHSGKPIDHQQFLEAALELAAKDKTLVEVFALDVIGDHKQSLKNCEKAWELGLRAIPTYHIGEPLDYLHYIANNFPKIALGGVAHTKGPKKMAWARDCFARVWPKKIHGFGFGSQTQIMGLPWHSVDASSWATGALKFGNWRAFGRMSIRGSNQNLRSEIEHYLKLERMARSRWAKEMKLVEERDPALPPLIER